MNIRDIEIRELERVELSLALGILEVGYSVKTGLQVVIINDGEYYKYFFINSKGLVIKKGKIEIKGIMGFNRGIIFYSANSLAAQKSNLPKRFLLHNN